MSSFLDLPINRQIRNLENHLNKSKRDKEKKREERKKIREKVERDIFN